MWSTDASCFRVSGWGFYYLLNVMDDFSRFILAWKLQTDMTSDPFIEVVQGAVDLTGMTDVPGYLEVAIAEFVNYYNNRRYQKALGTVTHSDVLDGRREQVLQKRKEVQTQTIQRRRLYNQQLRELVRSASNLH